MQHRLGAAELLGPRDTCLVWPTVGFFVEAGGVAAITLDLCEP